jgi:hypothetical protein
MVLLQRRKLAEAAFSAACIEAVQPSGSGRTSSARLELPNLIPATRLAANTRAISQGILHAGFMRPAVQRALPL